jgi:hypothetical protein
LRKFAHTCKPEMRDEEAFAQLRSGSTKRPRGALRFRKAPLGIASARSGLLRRALTSLIVAHLLGVDPASVQAVIGDLALHAAPPAARVRSTNGTRLLGAVLDADVPVARQGVIAVVVRLALVALIARNARRSSAVPTRFVLVLNVVVAVRGEAVLIERISLGVDEAQARATIYVFLAALIDIAGLAIAAPAVNVGFVRFLQAVVAARRHAHEVAVAARAVQTARSAVSVGVSAFVADRAVNALAVLAASVGPAIAEPLAGLNANAIAALVQ